MADTNLNGWKCTVRRARRAGFAAMRAGPLAAMLAGLALAGCSGTHVGDAWQCPISQGAVCTGVADADPAVPRTEPASRLALKRPLHEARGTTASAPPAVSETRPGGAGEARPCDTECGPLTWLARLFGADGGETDRGTAHQAAANRTALPLSVRDRAVRDRSVRDRPARDRAGDDGAAPMESTTAAASPAGPAGDDAAGDGPGGVDSVADDLRVPETLGRVWIGPFVDAGGLYREGAYVRVVIEPARWRLP